MLLKKGTFPLILGVVSLPFLGIYAYGVWRHILPLYPAAVVYAVMSLVTLAVYQRDKAAAVANDRRVPESALHLLELLGGWPGALLAQHLFRHKVKKMPYQVFFWLIVLLHGAGWYLVKTGGLDARTANLLPKNLTSALPKPDFVHSLKSALTPKLKPRPPQRAAAPKPQAPRAYTVPPLAVGAAWTNAPGAELLTNAPTPPRSRVPPPKQGRRLTGEIKSVSPALGVLVALPPEIGGDGVIAPATLIEDFPRRFRIGERIDVAVLGVNMKGSLKQVNLLLVDPPPPPPPKPEIKAKPPANTRKKR